MEGLDLFETQVLTFLLQILIEYGLAYSNDQ